MLDSNVAAQSLTPDAIMNTRLVLTGLWLGVTMSFGLAQVPMGTFAHYQSARRRDSTARVWSSLVHSLSDLHLFVFSIATCGGIMITISGTMISQSAAGHSSDPWGLLGLLVILLACALIILLSGVCWATDKTASGVQQLGSTTSSVSGDRQMITLSIACAVAAVAAGVITELVK